MSRVKESIPGAFTETLRPIRRDNRVVRASRFAFQATVENTQTATHHSECTTGYWLIPNDREDRDPSSYTVYYTSDESCNID